VWNQQGQSLVSGGWACWEIDDSAGDTFLASEHPRTQGKGKTLLLFVFMSTTLNTSTSEHSYEP
jgi:hypothetical protein